jgi:hypothetical protein
MGRPSPDLRLRLTFGKSPVRESRTPGPVRGDRGNPAPYRDRWPAPSNGQVRQDKFLEPLKAQFRRNLPPARTFRHFRPQKGERVSNQALAPEFSDSNTLPVEPTSPKTRNE